MIHQSDDLKMKDTHDTFSTVARALYDISTVVAILLEEDNITHRQQTLLRMIQTTACENASMCDMESGAIDEMLKLQKGSTETGATAT